MPGPQDQSPPVLTELEMGALRRLADVGCKQAAEALSILVSGEAVEIEARAPAQCGPQELGGLLGPGTGRIVGVATDIGGALGGRLLFALPAEAARMFAAGLLGQGGIEGELGEDARSTLCEVGNILGSACLSAMAQTFHGRLVPSVPEIVEDEASRVVLQVVRARLERTGRVLAVVTHFLVKGPRPFAADLVLFPDVHGVASLVPRLPSSFR